MIQHGMRAASVCRIHQDVNCLLWLEACSADPTHAGGNGRRARVGVCVCVCVVVCLCARMWANYRFTHPTPDASAPTHISLLWAAHSHWLRTPTHPREYPLGLLEGFLTTATRAIG